MPRPPPDPIRLTLLLQARGATAARALARELGVNASTVTRLVARLGSSIERIGAARSTRYALRREVRNLGNDWPIYRLNESGRSENWGSLRALHGGFRFQPRQGAPGWKEKDYPYGLFPDLPFFLQDLRPQGYLGRAIAREVAPRLGVPPDVRRWAYDDALSYFLTEGYDLPGDLVLGDHALERAVRSSGEAAPVAQSERDRIYPQRAAAAQRGEIVGSTAGGEQPKFLVTLRTGDGNTRPVLVKFSAAEHSPVSQRWADLLACEHLASELLRERAIACAKTEILDADGRRFLEVERFDRVGAVGRRGGLSLGALEDAFLDQSSGDWSSAAAALLGNRWITDADARMLRWAWCFGDLIANSDMHRANASFWFADTPPFRSAPFYDMLPMLYAPGAQGELAERPFTPRPPLAGVEDVWADAAAAAAKFWGRVVEDPRISKAFRLTAGRNAAIIGQMGRRFG